MAYFSYNIKDVKSISRNVTWLLYKPLIIIGICCVPLTVFYLPIGFIFNSKDHLYTGFSSLIIVLFASYNWIKTYCFYKKYLMSLFEKANADILEFYIEKKENIFYIGLLR